MSKDKKTKEPWEQPIYESDEESANSRSAKRGGKKGDGIFNTVLIILILLVIAVPTGLWYYATHGDNDLNNPTESQAVESTTSSKKVAASSSATTTSSSSESSESTTTTTTTAAPEATTTTSEQTIESTTQTTAADNTASGSYTVKAGDNLYRIAVNHGMTLDELKALNGISDNSISIGQTLKVK